MRSPLLRIVRSQPRTASLLSGNSVLRAGFFVPLRLASVFRRGYLLCSGVICNPPERGSELSWIANPAELSRSRRHARGEPSAELPAAHARRLWFMTAEEGV